MKKLILSVITIAFCLLLQLQIVTAQTNDELIVWAKAAIAKGD